MSFILRWLFSGTVREADQMRRHVRRLLRAQSDLLTPEAVAAVEVAAQGVRKETHEGGDAQAIRHAIAKLEEVGNKWLKSYPYASTRENIEVLLVAIAVAMAIRTFFLQPFKIPTGSMQPTLYGITHEDLRQRPDVVFPNPIISSLKFWLTGISYVSLKADADCELTAIEEPSRFILFNLRQRLWLSGRAVTLWFPPENLAQRAGLMAGQQFKANDDIIRLRVKSGDHLFVDRVSYNFRRPVRGEIIVFETRGVHVDTRVGNYQDIPQDQFYIKRLVGMPGERISIGKDQHLRVALDGQPPKTLTAATPHFENVYTFSPDAKDNEYFGHKPVGLLANDQTFDIRPNHYVVMGDNTRNSLDSRYWGDFPRENLIGKYCFVYWPFSERFGWAAR